MGWFEGIFLGIVQGLAEFLPISSSGHLAIFGYFLNVNEPGKTFEILLHFATLLSVIICYRKDLWELLKNPFQKYVLMIIVACVPAGIVGVFFNDFFDPLFDSIWFPTLALFVTAALLLFTDNFRGNKEGKDITFKIAILIGLMQMVAICPGISRSGTTIFAALLLGLSRTEAAKFSFIMSIPLILGSFMIECIDVVRGTADIVLEPVHFVSAAVACVFGVLAIKLFLFILNKGRMRYFAYYCCIIALASVTLLLLGL